MVWTYHNKPPLGWMLDLDEPINRGLIGLWLFNEGSGNKVQDLSGNGNTGILKADTHFVPGRFGSVLDFDGTGDYVDLGDIFSGLDRFTVTGWIKLNEISGDSALIGKWSGGNNQILIWEDDPDGWRAIIRDSEVNSPHTDHGDRAVIGQWEFIAVTYDKDGSFILYQDGAETSRNGIAPKGSPVKTDAGNFRIGIDRDDSRDFNGSIDDVMIWNRALSASEVALLYRFPFYGFKNPDEPVLDQYYRVPTILNGDFATDTDWVYTLDCEYAQYYGRYTDDAGGVAAGSIYQNDVIMVEGNVYTVTFELIRRDAPPESAAYVNVTLGDGFSEQIKTVGVHVVNLIAGAGNRITFGFMGNWNDWEQHIDNVSIRLARIDLTVNCIAQWKCNDIAATTELNESIANRDGILQRNASIITVPGKINTAIDFEVSNSDYATVPDNPVFSFGDSFNDSPFSIAAWVKLDSVVEVQNRVIITKGTSGNGYEYRFYIDNAGKLTARLYDASINKFRGQKADAAMADTNWHFVGMTYDGRGGTTAYNGVFLWIDGSIIADIVENNGGTYVAMEDTVTDLEIGSVAGGTTWYMNGAMDNIMMFDKVLTEAAWAFLYSNGNGVESLREITRPLVNGSLAGYGLVSKGLIR